MYTKKPENPDFLSNTKTNKKKKPHLIFELRGLRLAAVDVSASCVQLRSNSTFVKFVECCTFKMLQTALGVWLQNTPLSEKTRGFCHD